MLKRQKTLHVGEYHASKAPLILNTILGSCVAVCLFDPVQRIGGMNHILMPGTLNLKNFDMSARYGINAMELLINRIMNLGGDRCRLQAKLFGGAHLIPSIPENDSIGKRNADFSKKFLNKEGIKIINADLGGHATRKIYFHTDTGKVFLKRTYSDHYKEIAKVEMRQLDRMRKKFKRLSDVTLFK
ncbi:chemotaxis protein CheD [Desulfococcaceae bacterium HSG7]|nr:chemotaxis protein CheD [Desulfococcaceae bacterium HSG9]MDM8555307.1 chemotaxis protein CheD [Desulfococcaceae bacterium HSG7]